MGSSARVEVVMVRVKDWESNSKERGGGGGEGVPTPLFSKVMWERVSAFSSRGAVLRVKSLRALMPKAILSVNR